VNKRTVDGKSILDNRETKKLTKFDSANMFADTDVTDPNMKKGYERLLGLGHMHVSH
jgi:hypothetical protein